MKKKYIMIITFIGSFFMFWISMITLTAGRMLYKADASILWAMGILTYISMQGIVESFNNVIKKKQEDLK